MRIGDLARATGVKPRLLRYYEEQGLLTPLRQPNGYRQYARSDIAAVRHIRVLLAAGSLDGGIYPTRPRRRPM
jgi:DNA-binding transcriptional MerR regulator